MNEKTTVLSVLIIVYLYLSLFKSYRALAIWIGIALITLSGIISILNIPSAVNWNIIGIFAGTLVLAEFFTLSKVPAYLSDVLIGKSKNAGSAMLRVCVMSGFLSVFIENVAVVLITAPIALAVIKKLNISPVPMLIGIAVMSNLQGTATLIGDPPSMILAGQLKMNFNDFIIFHGKTGIFFAVEFGAIIGTLVLYFLFRKHKEPIEAVAREEVISWTPTFLLCLMILGLALSPIIDPDFSWLSGTICMIFGMLGAIWGLTYNKRETAHILKQYDWDTTLFLAGVFVLIWAFDSVGLIVDLKNLLVSYLGTNALLNYIFIIAFSIVVSGFLDNVPFIMLMIPVTHQMGIDIGHTYLLTFGLLVGTCFGGNITPVGASANIVATGLLRKEGYPISFWTFMKIGIPFTLAATIGGGLFIWLVWK